MNSIESFTNRHIVSKIKSTRMVGIVQSLFSSKMVCARGGGFVYINQSSHYSL
jgi:hypothetical protein